jgi:hypothetical protein
MSGRIDGYGRGQYYLLCDPPARGKAETSLLVGALHGRRRWEVVIESEAGEGDEAFRRLGFHEEHRLTWMTLDLAMTEGRRCCRSGLRPRGRELRRRNSVEEMWRSEERIKILKMVEEGKLTAEEAVQLLGTLGKSERKRTPATDVDSRWLRVRVTDLGTGKPKVNVNIPMRLVNVGLRVGALSSPTYMPNSPIVAGPGEG